MIEYHTLEFTRNGIGKQKDTQGMELGPIYNKDPSMSNVLYSIYMSILDFKILAPM